MATTSDSRILANSKGPMPPAVARARGVWITDTEGRTYLDGCSGAVVSNIGHCVPEVIESIGSQQRQYEFAYRGQFGNQPAEDLANTLCSLSHQPSGKVFFSSSGSEAVETATKLAIQYWVEQGEAQRSIILGANVSYHGATSGALSVSGAPIRRTAFEGMLAKHPSFAAPTCSRCPVGQLKETCSSQCLSKVGASDHSLEALLEEHGDRVAAVIIEPVGGATRASENPPIGYLKAIRALCDKFGVLLICDEVMTGGWRTGPFLAQQADDVVADLTVLGKGLAAGYAPISAVLISAQIVQVIETGSGVFAHGYTHAGNPTGAAAANSVLQYCVDQGVPANVAARSVELLAGLNRLAATHPVVRAVRGRGLLAGLEIADPTTDAPLKGGMRGSLALSGAAMKCGLVIYPCAALDASAVMVAPPLTITADELQELLSRLDAALQLLTKSELK